MIDNSKLTPDQDHKLAEALMQMLAHLDYAEKLSDEGLVNEVIDKVWARLNWDGPEETLLNELIQRFKARAGIEDAEEDDRN